MLAGPRYPGYLPSDYLKIRLAVLYTTSADILEIWSSARSPLRTSSSCLAYLRIRLATVFTASRRCDRRAAKHHGCNEEDYFQDDSSRDESNLALSQRYRPRHCKGYPQEGNQRRHHHVLDCAARSPPG